MAKRPKVSFAVDKYVYNQIKRYAKARGYDTASNLARVALARFMNKNPIRLQRKRMPESLEPLVYYGDMDKPGWVYFAKVVMNRKIYCKIGYTTTQSRYSQLKMGLPVDFEVIKEVYVGNCILAEKAFHSLFASKKVKNEWYELTEEDCKNIVEKGVYLIKDKE